MTTAGNVGEGVGENTGSAGQTGLRFIASTPVATSGHLLLNKFGDNVQWSGECMWALAVNSVEADMQTYMDDRASKGLNLVMMCAIYHLGYGVDNVPQWRNDNDSALPFDSWISGTSDLFDVSDPNDTYWSYVDKIVDYAFTKGITVAIAPMYIGFDQGGEGWVPTFAINSLSNCTDYGTFLGNRYKNKTNIIWVMGGDGIDTGPTANVSAKTNAIADAISATGAGHLFTAHSYRGRSSVDDYNRSWLDINATYASVPDTVTETEVTWNQSPTLPTYLIEGDYYGHTTFDDNAMLTQMWHPMLAGGNGHQMGIGGVWNQTDGQWPDGGSILDAHGGQWIEYLGRLLAVRDLPSYAPDHSDSWITSSKGSPGINEVVCRGGNDVLVAFMPGNTLVTVDLTNFSGTVNARWFNPKDGTNQANDPATYPNSSSGQFMSSPSGWDYAVLLLDRTTLNLGVP